MAGASSSGQRLQTLRGLAKRELRLYGAHIGLSLAGLIIFFAGAAWMGKPALLEVHGRDLFVDNPGLGMLGLVSLGHQLGYFNILPLYIILIAFVPVLLWLAAIDRRLMLGVSALVYGLFRLSGWNIPSWPAPGVWFFDPFAWQLLFAIGLAVGLNLRNAAVPRSRPLMIVCALIVGASAVVVTRGFGFGLSADAWQPVRDALDLDKAQLGLVRLVHFLALAYLIYGLGVTDWLRHWPALSSGRAARPSQPVGLRSTLAVQRAVAGSGGGCDADDRAGFDVPRRQHRDHLSGDPLDRHGQRPGLFARRRRGDRAVRLAALIAPAAGAARHSTARSPNPVNF